jgi:hypothetical protein
LPEAEGAAALAADAAAGERVLLLFGGPTALARAFLALEAACCNGAIVSAPRGGSPCGLAIAVPRDRLPAARETLRALGLPAAEAPG